MVAVLELQLVVHIYPRGSVV